MSYSFSIPIHSDSMNEEPWDRCEHEKICNTNGLKFETSWFTEPQTSWRHISPKLENKNSARTSGLVRKRTWPIYTGWALLEPTCISKIGHFVRPAPDLWVQKIQILSNMASNIYGDYPGSSGYSLLRMCGYLVQFGCGSRSKSVTVSVSLGPAKKSGEHVRRQNPCSAGQSITSFTMPVRVVWAQF